MIRSLALALAGALALAPAPAPAQPAPAPDSLRDDRGFSFYDRGPYRAGVPRPEQILGYEIGAMNTQYAAQEKVLLAIADAAKDRVRVETIGATTERRPMRIFIVSSPANIARLDEIRADLERLADPRGRTAAELDAIVKRTPPVVWISESVHGNESPGFESGMQLLYQLAASDEPATTRALENAIVVLNPSSNPDGHERFTVWYNSINVGDPDPGAMEHREPWSVQGRFNHYRFDMNRDLIATTQREVQAITRAMLRWRPMVAVDQHGQTTNYFFPPAARPVNRNLGDDAAKWLEIIGEGNAAAFDRHGWMYYSRDVFDLYYPGYYDTWPGLTGATGMTYETDGGGWKGLLWRRDDGTLLSFRDGIAKHWVAALATIETVAGRAEERVRDYLRFRQRAVEEGRTGAIRRVVLLPGDDPARAAELATALVRAGVEVRRAAQPFASARAHDYATDGAGPRRFDAGVYVVDLAQPQGKLAKSVLEPQSVLDPLFAARMEARFARNQRRGEAQQEEYYEFYDVTAWSLPVAFGVDAYWTEDAQPVTGELLPMPAPEPLSPEAREQPRRVGGEILAVEVGGGIAGGERARSAYVFPPTRNGASRLAYHLLREGVRLGVSTEPLEAAGREWPRGTYVVRVGRNDSTLHARLDRLARESGVEVTAVQTAFTSPKAQYGVGSEPVVNLTLPRIALVGDEGVSQTGYGAIWWTLERRYGVRFTPITLDRLAGGDIDAFDVILLPDASPGALRRRLGKDGASRLRDWVREGNVLVTMGRSSSWAADEGVDLTSARLVGADAKPDTTGILPPPDAAAARDDAGMAKRELSVALPVTSPTASTAAPAPVPGTHFDVQLDPTHWLTFGYERPRLTVMLEGDAFYTLSKKGANVAVFPKTGPLTRSGFVWPENTERLLRGTAFLVDEPIGDGHVILFANEPMFRGWWRALDRVVMNAVVLGPSM